MILQVLCQGCSPVILEYWRHHLRAPFADFEGERERELAETKARLRPYASATGSDRSADPPTTQEESILASESV